jgi:hypothetical protein
MTDSLLSPDDREPPDADEPGAETQAEPGDPGVPHGAPEEDEGRSGK